MGYIKHHAIVVTCWGEGEAQEAADCARNLGLEVIGPSAPAINAYQSILICPDGSKEGWLDSDDGNAKRAYFVSWLRENHAGEWVEVAYGDDDGEASVVTHAWASAAHQDAKAQG